MATETRLTWDEFLAVGEEWQRWEFVDGEVEFMSPANNLHGLVITQLAMALGRYCEAHPEWVCISGDAAFTMSSGNWRCPDVALVRLERYPGRQVPAAPADFPPDVAFEICSPKDTAKLIQKKRRDYQESNVIQVWIDPADRIAEVVHADRPAQYFNETQLLVIEKLPGFALDLKRLFSI